MIEYILFDMDNCLYPASSGLCTEMGRRICRFVADLLSLPYEKAYLLRNKNVEVFGTTLKWLESAYNFSDIDEYNRVIHPPDVENYLVPASELKEMLSALPCGASVLTNAPMIHANRVLKYLGITENFDYILELGFSGTMGKPHVQTYLKALETCGCKIESTLFIDDVPGYLLPFHEIGGHILLVDESGRHSEKGLPSVKNIMELPGHLDALNREEEEKMKIGV